MRILVLAIGFISMSGCTHHSLSRNTVQTTTTVMDIQYQSVLANFAMMTCHPESLPNHVHLADGVVQIGDQVGFGQAGGFSTFSGMNFGIDRFGPSARRLVSEQWGTDATTDPERLYDLQSLYRVGMGIAPLPPPNSIAYLRQQEPTAKESSEKKSANSDDKVNRRVPLDVLLTDVPPPGWYHVGRLKDVPRNATYVGRWGRRYAWVTANEVPQLSRFTTTVLLVIKLKPGEREGGKSSLAITGGN